MSQKLKFKLLSSEKSFLVRKDNKIVLMTKSFVEKKDIQDFIEKTFDVKVLNINSLILKGKIKTRRKISVKLPDKKKFYITVDNLEKFEKVENNNVEAV